MPVHFQETVGDMFDVGADVIVHQINCLTVRPHGLSEILKLKYPYSDRYGQRRPTSPGGNLAIPQDRDKPGTIAVMKPSPSFANGPVIVGILGQFEMGKPFAYKRVHGSDIPEDSAAQRQVWFAQGLQALAKWILENPGANVIVFPKFIGCGLAGGDWKVYRELIVQHLVDRLRTDDNNNNIPSTRNITIKIVFKPTEIKKRSSSSSSS
jgi:hypothetical protein